MLEIDTQGHPAAQVLKALRSGDFRRSCQATGVNVKENTATDIETGTGTAPGRMRTQWMGETKNRLVLIPVRGEELSNYFRL